MSTATVNDAAWLAYPFTWRNNRGTAILNGKYVRFGIPEPRGRESDDDMKGSDRIGFTPVIITPDMVGSTVAVFTGIEIKGHGDRLKPGQRKWHSFLLDHGARSEIWIELADGTIDVIREEMDE
jgi:hypothetical protein